MVTATRLVVEAQCTPVMTHGACAHENSGFGAIRRNSPQTWNRSSVRLPVTTRVSIGARVTLCG